MKKLASVLGAGGFLLTIASNALAQGTIDITNSVGNQLPVFSINQFISWAIRVIIIIAFVLAFVFLLIGGIRWILAGGEEKAIGSARGMVTGALIGLVIVLSAFAIIKLIETFFGVIIISGPFNVPTIPTQPV